MIYIATQDTLDSLFSKFTFKLISTSKSEFLYYDTYCGELLKNSRYLVRTKDYTELRMTSSELVARAKNQKDIKFAWDIKDVHLRGVVGGLIEYRALVLKDKIIAQESQYLAVNDYDKGIFRVYQYIIDEGIVVKLEPIRGFQADFLGANDIFSSSIKIDSLFDFVKKEVPKKQKPKLDPSMSSKDALKVLLSDIYADMRAEELGLIANIDSEFLHYYRVYLRKARALISQFKTVFTQDELLHTRAGLSKIGQTTNQARDLDVYWLKVREYQEANPHRDLSLFLDFLWQSSKAEYKNLAKFFKSAEYEAICLQFQKIFGEDGANGAQANSNISQMVGKKIKKLYKKLIADGGLLHHKSKDELFHELRIDCKKIRYLLESFEQILDKSSASAAIKLIKELQTILGNFQDLSVQQQKIISLADDMIRKTGKSDSATMIAIGTIVGELEREQKKCKKLFFKSFSELMKPQNQEVFVNLYAKAMDDHNCDI